MTRCRTAIRGERSWPRRRRAARLGCSLERRVVAQTSSPISGASADEALDPPAGRGKNRYMDRHGDATPTGRQKLRGARATRRTG